MRKVEKMIGSHGFLGVSIVFFALAWMWFRDVVMEGVEDYNDPTMDYD